MKSLLFPAGFVAGMPAVGLLFLRLICGIGLAFHGWPKIQNPTSWMGPDVPAFMQLFAAAAEFLGGIAIAVGFLTPLACLAAISTMFVAVWVHLTNEATPTYFVKFDQRGPGDSYELALIYFVMSLAILLAGPGKLAIDALWADRKRGN